MSKTYLAVVTKTAEIEVSVDEAFEWLRKHDIYTLGCLNTMTDEDLIENYVMMVEGAEIDVEYERTITVASELRLPAALRDAGYTAEEMEKDNPYNQWMPPL